MSYWLCVTSGPKFEESHSLFAFECQDAAEVQTTAEWLSGRLQDVCTIEQLSGEMVRKLKKMDDLNQRLP